MDATASGKRKGEVMNFQACSLRVPTVRRPADVRLPMRSVTLYSLLLDIMQRLEGATLALSEERGAQLVFLWWVGDVV